jgi:hypothetical protein
MKVSSFTLKDDSHHGWTFALAQVAVAPGSTAVPRPTASSLMPLRQAPHGLRPRAVGVFEARLLATLVDEEAGVGGEAK